MSHGLQVKRAIQLRNIVTSLGPAYIKLGQALSIRPDILSPAAMNELQKLCDKVPSFDSDDAMRVLAAELGCPWQEVRQLPFAVLKLLPHVPPGVHHGSCQPHMSCSSCMVTPMVSAPYLMLQGCPLSVGHTMRPHASPPVGWDSAHSGDG